MSTTTSMTLRHFKIRTDHGALKWLMNFRNPEARSQGGSRYLGYMIFKLIIAKDEMPVLIASNVNVTRRKKSAKIIQVAQRMKEKKVK